MRLRRSARWAGSSASGIMTDGAILRGLIPLHHEAVGPRQDLDWMVGAERLGFVFAGGHLHHLHLMLGRERAFRGDMVGIVLQGCLCRGLADLDRDLEILGAGAPDAAMAAAALDHPNARLGD